MPRTPLALAAVVSIALCWGAAAPAAPAAPLAPRSSLDRSQTFDGTLNVHTTGDSVVVVVHAPDAVDHLFRVDTGWDPALPIELGPTVGQVTVWRGNLVVIAPMENRALHFSMTPPRHPAARSPVAAALAPPPATDLDRTLGESYELTRIDRATAIITRSGPLALAEPAGGDLGTAVGRALNRDPSNGGNGHCGTSCEIACGDGSQCSATCSSPRCAKCSCPASCSCS